MSQFPITVTKSCQQEINAHAEDAFPEECCGAMLGRDLEDGSREVVAVLRVENTKGENRKRRYLIDPKDQLGFERKAREMKLDVVGIYHSHPNHPSQASEFDRVHAMPYWSYLIVSCMEGKCASTQSWRLRDDRSVFDEETLAFVGD